MALGGVFGPYVRWRPAQGMHEVNTREVTVAASQTIIIGDILSLSSGALQQSIAAPSAGTATLSGGNLPIAGIAVFPITTSAAGSEQDVAYLRTQTSIAIFDDNLNILLPGASATGTSATLASFTQPNKYQFGRFTNAGNTASWYFVSTTTTNGEMTYEESTVDNVSSTPYPTLWLKAALSATVRQYG